MNSEIDVKDVFNSDGIKVATANVNRRTGKILSISAFIDPISLDIPKGEPCT